MPSARQSAAPFVPSARSLAVLREAVQQCEGCDAELETIRPRLIVCLGAVAAQSLLGASFRITQSHGEIRTVDGLPPIIATSHPSAILRAPTSKDRQRGIELLLEDLRKAAT